MLTEEAAIEIFLACSRDDDGDVIRTYIQVSARLSGVGTLVFTLTMLLDSSPG